MFGKGSKVRSRVGLLGLFCMVCVSAYLIYISGSEGYDIITGKLNPWDFVFNLVLFLLAIGALFGAIKMARNIFLIDHVFDTTFEEEIYPRLEPALREVAKMQVKMDTMEQKLDQVNMNVNRVKENPPTYKDPVRSIASRMKVFMLYIFILNLTVGFLIYIFTYPSNSNPYLLTVLFPTWWFVVTLDYKLFKKDIVWFWAFFPIMVTPVGIMVLGISAVRYGDILGYIALFLLIYVLVYHSWAAYYVEGITPLDRLKKLRTAYDDEEPEVTMKKVAQKKKPKKSLGPQPPKKKSNRPGKVALPKGKTNGQKMKSSAQPQIGGEVQVDPRDVDSETGMTSSEFIEKLPAKGQPAKQKKGPNWNEPFEK
jgi:hypothetical protein